MRNIFAIFCIINTLQIIIILTQLLLVPKYKYVEYYLQFLTSPQWITVTNTHSSDAEQ